MMFYRLPGKVEGSLERCHGVGLHCREIGQYGESAV